MLAKPTADPKTDQTNPDWLFQVFDEVEFIFDKNYKWFVAEYSIKKSSSQY